MKSLYILCEYGVPVSIVKRMIERGVVFDDLSKTSKENSTISSIANGSDDYHSIYELTEYGLSTYLCNKIFETVVHITELTPNNLLKYGFRGSDFNKIQSAYNKWADYNGFPSLNNSEMCINHASIDDNDENPFSIYNLTKFGLSQALVYKLIANGINDIRKIVVNVLKKHCFSNSECKDVVSAYNKWADNNDFPLLIVTETQEVPLLSSFDDNSQLLTVTETNIDHNNIEEDTKDHYDVINLINFGLTKHIVFKLRENGINDIRNIPDNLISNNNISFSNYKKIICAYNKWANCSDLPSLDSNLRTYNLVDFGLSKLLVDKLISNGINDIRNISAEHLTEYNIKGLNHKKIMMAYDKWANTNGYKLLSEIQLKELILQQYNHNVFTKEDIKDIVKKNNFDIGNFDGVFSKINLRRKGEKYYIPFDVQDLAKYGLSNYYINFLTDNNIHIDDINISFKNYNIGQKSFDKIFEAYKRFLLDSHYEPIINASQLKLELRKKYGFNPFSLDDIYSLFPNQELYDADNNILVLLEEKKIVECNYDKDKFINVFPKLEGELSKIIKSYNHQIVIDRFQGMTLEEIGKKNSITRERVRQIVEKELNRLDTVDEDKYSNIFQKYDFDEDVFCKMYNETKQTYYYLKERYTKGIIDVYELLSNKELTEKQCEVIRSKYKIILYNGEEIITNKTSILLAILKENIKKISFEEIIIRYNNVIEKFELNLDKITLREEHNIDGLLSRNKYVLCSLYRFYRYYDYTILNDETIRMLKKMLNVEPGFYSAKFFLNKYKNLMKMIDIDNEYELHNLLKKYVGDYNNLITYSRMPIIIIGDINQESFIENKIKELAPIKLDNFLLNICQNYGQKIDTLRSYVVAHFSKYINNKDGISYLISDCIKFNDGQFKFMKDYLTEDFYSIIEIKQLLIDQFNDIKLELLTSINFNDLGYRIRGNYLLKKNITNFEKFLKDKILSQDYLVLTTDIKKSIKNYTNYLYMFINDRQLFRVDKEQEKYITVTKLNNMGITKSDIDEYILNIENCTPEDKYFNLYSLNPNFKSKLNEYDFPPCFFESLILLADGVKRISVNKNTFFIKTKNSKVNKGNFLDRISNEINSTAPSLIQSEIKRRYDVDIDQSYIKQFNKIE